MADGMVTTDPEHTAPRFFGPTEEVAPGVLMQAAFVNTYAVATPAGLVLVDPGFTHTSTTLFDAVRGWSAAPLRTAIYTHGHVDHAFGLGAFLDAGERPDIVAQENCLARFRRYGAMHGWNAAINQRQFSLPTPTFVRRFDWPTVLVRDALVQRLGDVTLDIRSARGETDDALWVWIPERRHLFTGDLVIWQAPNCGNPQKVQRYPEEWADALEAMAGLGAEWLFPGHGLAIRGVEAIRVFLGNTARYLRVIVEQVRARMNAGETPEAILHGVEPDPDLARLPYLQPTYDHPKFIVRNLLRLWGGWWNGNAADLLPATLAEQAGEVARLAGGADVLVARGRVLLAAGRSDLAAHLAEWATRAAPNDRGAQEFKRDVYAWRLREERSLMARGIYRAAMNDARRELGEEPDRGVDPGMSILARGR